MSSFAETVAAHIRMLEAGQTLSAIDHHMADFGVIYLNGHVLAEGLAACRAQQGATDNSISGGPRRITDLHIDPHSEFCVFCKRTSPDNHTSDTESDELRVQMWIQGKIAIEWRYTDEPMRGMMARGILKDPAHILELNG